MSNSEKSSVYLDPFEMDLIKCVDKYLGNANLLLAVSGGMDSMALLKSLHRVSDKRDLKIRVCYVHHGKQGESDYRDRCYDLVKKTAQDFSLDFVSNYPDDLPDKVLGSEEDFREFRYRFLEKVAEKMEWRVIKKNTSKIFLHAGQSASKAEYFPALHSNPKNLPKSSLVLSVDRNLLFLSG